MFTGIVEQIGKVTRLDRRGGSVRLAVDLGPLTVGTRIGDSVCISGVCLTVVALDGTVADFDAIEETLARTTLARLTIGDMVNLERALAAGDRFGGHFVQGHVDGLATVARIVPKGTEVRFHFKAERKLGRMMIPKGSIAIDGISLTIAELGEDHFAVAIIPHTLEVTTLGAKQVGDSVNIETDMLGKYVLKQLAGFQQSDISEGFLREHGFA